MDSKVFKLINRARTHPEDFSRVLNEIRFEIGKAAVSGQVWDTGLVKSDVTAVVELLKQEMPALQFTRFENSPKTIRLPNESHPLLVCVHVLMNFKDCVFDANLDEICINADKPSEDLILKLSFRRSPYKTLSSTQTLKAFQDKSRKVAQEILSNPTLKKKFKHLMLKGNSWITELARIYGPFTGYELNEFITWFKTGENALPKQKPRPKAFDPKPPVLSEKIIVNEAGISPEGTVTINKLTSSQSSLHPVELSTNSFCPKTDSSVKFTFKAKQRYKDLQNLIHSTNGNLNEALIKSLPEKDCEETLKDPPISVPEKYEAFLIEEVLIPPPMAQTAPVQKAMFTTNFRLPDNMKIKTETAKQVLSSTKIVMEDPYVHTFRDDFDPKAAGKPEFVLRLPKPKTEIVERFSQPMESVKQQQREEKRRMEEEEKKRRTELYGKIRGEWVFGFKPVSSFYEMGTGQPHKLLPKEEFVETFKVNSRAS